MMNISHGQTSVGNDLNYTKDQRWNKGDATSSLDQQILFLLNFVDIEVGIIVPIQTLK